MLKDRLQGTDIIIFTIVYIYIRNNNIYFLGSIIYLETKCVTSVKVV